MFQKKGTEISREASVEQLHMMRQRPQTRARRKESNERTVLLDWLERDGAYSYTTPAPHAPPPSILTNSRTRTEGEGGGRMRVQISYISHTILTGNVKTIFSKLATLTIFGERLNRGRDFRIRLAHKIKTSYRRSKSWRKKYIVSDFLLCGPGRRK